MRNLSLLKGLVVGVALATVGGVAQAVWFKPLPNQGRSSDLTNSSIAIAGGVLDDAWVVVGTAIFKCRSSGKEALCVQAEKVWAIPDE